jgi:hypothetical protein
VAQDALALAKPQAVPHAPQFESVASELSQPLVGLPSQLAKPVLQAGVHAPATHEVVPLAFVQAVPHTPQFATLDLRSVSQPLGRLPSQLAKLALQTGVHAPATQEVVPLTFVHTVPQAPQFETLVRRSASQPFAALPSQLPKPALQTGAHAPATQEVVPLAFVQALPHAPQLERLVAVLVSQPLPALPSQLANPELQVGEQAPATHAVVPFAFVHATAQPPQFEVVSSAVSQPFAGLPSQSARPLPQVT